LVQRRRSERRDASGWRPSLAAANNNLDAMKTLIAQGRHRREQWRGALALAVAQKRNQGGCCALAKDGAR
jgi:hypothetical protein